MLWTFLSYARKDHIFAELAHKMLNTQEISLWRDTAQIRGGDRWEHEIEKAISRSHVVLVALSRNSVDSSYVTYEWAYGIGKGKPIIPLVLEDCEVHPRLRGVQHLDFTQAGALPWKPLIDRIKEIDVDINSIDSPEDDGAYRPPTDPKVREILQYLDQKVFQMASFERLRKHVSGKPSNTAFQSIVSNNPETFRSATLRGNKPGLAKLVP
ncbi:toll/interleukin-1 receptor domain-containing protein [Hoeflea sp.]|uniref:toll/interleukin-1 receptor domain-containing protein n=1 Tax=Hoeflea sp. TaxID=1940281 RepID=UPI003B027B68